MHLYNLKCCGQESPLQLVAEYPVFSWMICGEGKYEVDRFPITSLLQKKMALFAGTPGRWIQRRRSRSCMREPI